MANKKSKIVDNSRYLDEDYNLRVRKRVIITVAILTILGQGVYVGYQSYNLGQKFTLERLTASGPVIVVAFIALLLSIFNRVRVAGYLYCLVGVFGVSYGVYSFGINTIIPILYLMVIIIAGVLITPTAVIIFGGLSTLAYVGVSIYSISRMTNPDSSLGYYTALAATIIIIASSALYLFSSNLSKIAASARQQAEELRRANQRLITQRQLEIETNIQISNLSDLLAQISHQQNLSTTEQVNLVTEVASTTQELDAAARRIANNALTVSTMAEKALKSAEQGQSAAQDGVMAIAGLRARVENITQSVRYLNSQIERIKEVTDIIGEIADETNLLALNATIEAAGAREYGRRFAAVAEEVQRLSRRTTAAVEQIKEVVTEITQASNKSLETTEEGMKQAQQGTDLVVRLSQANEEIITMVNQTAELATNIATSTQQQRAASEQIVGNIQRISVSANELARVGGQVTEIVTNLELSANRLTDNQDNQNESPVNSVTRTK